MLYKKYHRNFIKRFKKGVKFACGDGIRYSRSRHTVERDPYYDAFVSVIRMTSNKGIWNLLYPNGKINKYLYVIQKIS